jgi:hypothetical protein
MIAVGEKQAERQGVQPAVLEREERTAKPERGEHCMVRDGTESEDRAEPGHRADLGDEKPAAVCDFALLGLVERRNTPHSIGNARSSQFETVIRTGRIAALRKAELTQGLIQEITSIIAGEWASGPVRSSQTGRESDDQQLGLQIAERRYGGVEPSRVGPDLGLPESRQAWAETTIRRWQGHRGRKTHASSTGSVRGAR